MRKGDTQLGTPQILYKDTQATIEALSGVPEGAIAFATDTDQVGTYNGATWAWAISGTGIVGQVAEFVTNTKTIQAAKIIAPATNILTLTNAAPATLALDITSAKTLTLTAADNYTLTIPATGTAALMTFENVGTLNADNFDFDASTATEGWLSQNGNKILHTYGFVDHLFLGVNVGNTTTTTATGKNYGFGYKVLQALTTGFHNVGVGYDTLNALQDGTYNVALGTYSLNSMTSGTGNMAIGYYALHDLVSTSYNVAIGTEALRRCTNSYNVAIGASAGQAIVNVAGNTFIGAAAGFNTTGQENTMIGRDAGWTNVAGIRNTYIGRNAGRSGSGSNNIAIGYQAGYWETGTKKLFISPDEGGTTEATSREFSFIYGDMNIGSTNRLQVNVATTTTNAVLPALKLQSRVSTASTGSSNGFGTALDMFAETATDETYQQLAKIAASWNDATNASRKATLTLTAYDTASKFGASFSADGTSTNAISVLGAGAGKITLSAPADYTLTVPATGTTALLATANVFTATQKIETANGDNTKLILNSITDANAWNISLSFQWANVEKFQFSGLKSGGVFYLGLYDVSGRYPWMMKPSTGSMGVNRDISYYTIVAQLDVAINGTSDKGIIVRNPYAGYYTQNIYEALVEDDLSFGYDVGTVWAIDSNGKETLDMLTLTGNTIQEVAHFGIRNKTASTGGANGFGSALGLYAETATHGTYQQQGKISTVYIDSTNATRKSDLIGSAFDTAEREGWRVRADGTQALVGIGGTIPTARLHLPAGSATANTAPLKFTSGALLSSVEAGAMEYYNNALWFTNLAVRRTVVQGQSVRTSALTIANDGAETTIFTQAHGANYLQVGKMEDIMVYGVVSSNSGVSDTATVRIKYAGTTLGSFTVPKSLTSAAFSIEVVTTCRAIGAGTTVIQVHASMEIDGVTKEPHYIGTSTGLDSTTAQATEITWDWTTASAGNTVTINQARALSIDNNA